MDAHHRVGRAPMRGRASMRSAEQLDHIASSRCRRGVAAAPCAGRCHRCPAIRGRAGQRSVQANSAAGRPSGGPMVRILFPPAEKSRANPTSSERGPAKLWSLFSRVIPCKSPYPIGASRETPDHADESEDFVLLPLPAHQTLRYHRGSGVLRSVPPRVAPAGYRTCPARTPPRRRPLPNCATTQRCSTPAAPRRGRHPGLD